MQDERLFFGRDHDEMVMGMNREPLKEQILALIRRMFLRGVLKNSSSAEEEKPLSQEPIEI